MLVLFRPVPQLMTGYAERLHLKFTGQQLFDLVADVGPYPEFVHG